MESHVTVSYGGEEGTREACGKRLEPRFTQLCISLQKKLYLVRRGACGGSRVALGFFSFLVCCFLVFFLFFHILKNNL